MISWLLLIGSFIHAAESAPAYEKEISERAKVQAETRQQDQKSFYEAINGKTQEVMRYLRTTKDDLRKQQEALRKEFDAKLKAEMEAAKKQNPRVDLDALRKSANDQRRQLIEKFNGEKKSLESQLQGYKKSFDEFVKAQRENFQQQLKIISAKASAAKLPPAESPLQQEFREIPPGAGTVLKPE